MAWSQARSAGSSRSRVLAHRYVGRGACAEVRRRAEAEVLIAGPAGTGKSRACLEKLHEMMLRNPGAAGLIVRKTHASLGSTGLKTFREHVIKESLTGGDVNWYGGSPQEPPQYRYSNGSKIMIGGMDNPTKIMSSDYDMVYVQEATELTETDWEYLTTRLRNGKTGYAQLIADCNPDRPTHWLKVRADRGDLVMLHSQHTDNPTLYGSDGARTPAGEAYLAILDKLTGVRRLRLRDGLWAAAEGIIYEEWNPGIHLLDDFPIPSTWARWWTVDFGHTNPFVLQCWAEDGDGRLFLYREIYMTKRLVEDHARQILSIVAPDGTWIEPKPRAIICDHDAEDRATLERHLGMGTVAARKTVSDGLQATAVRMRPAGDGRPRIAILRGALVERDEALAQAAKPCCTAEEIPGYVWDTSAGKKLKEQPLKEDDHGCDGMRYVVAHRDLQKRPRISFM